MRDPQGEQTALTYKRLRLAIGGLGIALPVVLVVVNWAIWGGAVPLGSISAYYYTHVGVWFVGTMFTIGVFLLAYRYQTTQRWIGHITSFAGLAAIVVGLFPTNPSSGSTPTQHVIAHVHQIAAGTLFVILGLISLFVFPSASSEEEQFTHADLIYRMLGGVILLSCLGAWLFHRVHGALFYFETAAVAPFAVSWLLRGQVGPVAVATARRVRSLIIRQ